MTRLPTKQLGELCEVEGGNAAPQGDEHFKDGTIPFVRMKDLGRQHLTNNLTDTEDKLTEASVAGNRMKLFEPGCILFPRSGSVALNHRAILGVAACIVSHIGVLQRLRPEITTGYLYLYLTTFDMTSLSKRTTGVDSIAFADVKRIPVPLPPLVEQEQIVRLLTDADELRKLRGEADCRTSSLIPALFHDMFGEPDLTSFPVKQIAELVLPERPITYGILKPGPDILDGVPYVRVLDIKQNRLHADQLLRTTEQIASQYRRSTLFPGDILVTIRGTVGRTCIVPQELKGANITQDTARLAVTPALEARYVVEFLNTPWAQNWMSHRVLGQAVKGLNLGDLRKLPVPVPPLPVQKDFAERAAEIRKLEADQAAGRCRLEDLFQSLLHRAFRGEL